MFGLLHHKARRGVERLHVSPRNENVFPAVVVEISDVRRIARHGQAESGHAALLGDFDEAAFARVAIDREGFVVEGDQDDVGITVVIQIAEVDAHAGDERAVFAQCDVHVESDFVELAVTFISKEPVEQLVVGDDQIHLAVQIRNRRRPRPCPCRDARAGPIRPRRRGTFRRHC